MIPQSYLTLFHNSQVKLSSQITIDKNLKSKIINTANTNITTNRKPLAITFKQKSFAEKIYDKKLVTKIFSQKIEFIDANTKEKAAEYAKNILGIKKIDNKLSLDMLNIINKGVTDVINKNIGQPILVPKSYFYDIKNNEFNAYVQGCIYNKNFARLALCKQSFDAELLDKKIFKEFQGQMNEIIKKRLDFNEINVTKNVNEGLHILPVFTENLKNIIKKYLLKLQSLTLKEKFELANTDISSIILPSDRLTKHIDFVKLIKDNNLEININTIKDLAPINQYEIINKYLIDKNEKIVKFTELKPNQNELSIIYHEMGHLQDWAKNLKNEDSKSFGSLKKMLFMTKNSSDRWADKSEKYLVKKFKQTPENFKEIYPRTYEFWTNDKIKKTAQKVSEYSKNGIGEFIAETYSKMISGEKLPDDVVLLYKKYNGPMLASNNKNFYTTV